VFKKTKRVIIISGALYVWAVKSFNPSPKELLSPSWHRGVPIRIAARGLTRLLPALYQRFGEKGVRTLQYVFYQIGRDRAPILQEALEIDPYDARSLGRVLDYEDGVVGVKGIWVEETKGRAVKEERFCPAAEELSCCPEVCTCLFMAMEAGTFSELNPDVEVPELTDLLSLGDDCCLATIELADLSRREGRKPSPQATPGAFPPRITVSGLQQRLALQSLRSMVYAVWTLLTKGPDQPMQWYEFFRYNPESNFLHS